MTLRKDITKVIVTAYFVSEGDAENFISLDKKQNVFDEDISVKELIIWACGNLPKNKWFVLTKLEIRPAED